MRRRLVIFLGALLMAFTAQEAVRAPQRVTAVRAESAPPASQVLPRRAFAHDAEIVERYDPRTDTTTVATGPGNDDIFGRLWSPDGLLTGIDFSASFSFRDRVMQAPPAQVVLEFETFGDVQPADRPWGLELRADGRPLPVRETPQPSAASGGTTFLATTATLDRAAFLDLVNASRVEGRVWGHPFVFSAQQLELLRDLASRLEPASR
ncbi:MAG TPA: hypothetical protein VIL35_12140 [Vicinamibacterales bacterium]